MAHKLTPLQSRLLRKGLNGAEWPKSEKSQKEVTRLCDRGLVRYGSHHGYETNNEGKAALHKGKPLTGWVGDLNISEDHSTHRVIRSPTSRSGKARYSL